MSLPLLRWVVTEPRSLKSLLAEQGVESALAEGRVFVDARRTTHDESLSSGARVELFAARPSAAIALLGERSDVFAVHKPASLPTEPDHSGADCVLSQLARLLKVEQRSLFALSRLDVGVSGVLLVTLGARSRERLLAERAAGRIQRRYIALGGGVPAPPSGEWRDAIGSAGHAKRRVGGEGAEPACSRYRVVATAGAVAPGGSHTCVLALSPVTGRTHQLRVHASAHGAPLLGDRKYGGPVRLTTPSGSVHSIARILLHAAWVEWPGAPRFLAEPAPELVDTWLSLGGELGAIQLALD
jgi:23S rRNA-/tRNA-specific pseudouridylate synthase